VTVAEQRRVHVDPDRGDPDSDLVSAAAAGDDRAFATLYARHADGAHRLLSRLVGCVDEREDLLQDVFLRLHRALGSFRADARFTTFLHRIVVNVAYDFLAARRRRPVAVDLAELVYLHDHRPSPVQQAQRAEELARTLAYLERLDPRHRIAYVLREVAGYSYPEIAQLVGAWAATVRMRVKLAHRRLARMIAEEDQP